MWPNCARRHEEEGTPIRVTYAPELIGTEPRLSDADLVDRLSDGQATDVRHTEPVGDGTSADEHIRSHLSAPIQRRRTNEDPDPQKYWDFSKYSEVSYGYQVPFGKLGQPRPTCDLRMPTGRRQGPLRRRTRSRQTQPGSPDGQGPAGTPMHGNPGTRPTIAAKARTCSSPTATWTGPNSRSSASKMTTSILAGPTAHERSGAERRQSADPHPRPAADRNRGPGERYGYTDLSVTDDSRGT